MRRTTARGARWRRTGGRIALKVPPLGRIRRHGPTRHAPAQPHAPRSCSSLGTITAVHEPPTYRLPEAGARLCHRDLDHGRDRGHRPQHRLGHGLPRLAAVSRSGHPSVGRHRRLARVDPSLVGRGHRVPRAGAARLRLPHPACDALAGGGVGRGPRDRRLPGLPGQGHRGHEQLGGDRAGPPGHGHDPAGRLPVRAHPLALPGGAAGTRRLAAHPAARRFRGHLRLHRAALRRRDHVPGRRPWCSRLCRAHLPRVAALRRSAHPRLLRRSDGLQPADAPVLTPHRGGHRGGHRPRHHRRRLARGAASRDRR